jgi:hypothetical protein
VIKKKIFSIVYSELKFTAYCTKCIFFNRVKNIFCPLFFDIKIIMEIQNDTFNVLPFENDIFNI